MGLHPTQDGGLEAAEAEIERIALHLGRGKTHRMKMTKRSQFVDDRTARIPEAQELGDFVEGFAGGVVAGFSEQAVMKTIKHFEQVGMTPANHERERRQLDGLGLHDHSVNMALDMVHSNQRHTCCETQRFSVGQSNEERTQET